MHWAGASPSTGRTSGVALRPSCGGGCWALGKICLLKKGLLSSILKDAEEPARQRDRMSRDLESEWAISSGWLTLREGWMINISFSRWPIWHSEMVIKNPAKSKMRPQWLHHCLLVHLYLFYWGEMTVLIKANAKSSNANVSNYGPPLKIPSLRLKLARGVCFKQKQTSEVVC